MICRDYPPMGGCVGGWMGQWVNGGWVGQWVGSLQITKNRINLELMEIIQFCLKIYDLLRTPSPMGGCMGSWVVGSVNGWGQVKLLKIQ